MADVPHQPVTRRVEHIMDRGGEFDDTQTRPQMAPGHADRGNHLRAQLIRELRN